MTAAPNLQAAPALAEAEKEVIRVRLAARADSHDVLEMLAQDRSVTVRAAVALNPLIAHAAHGHLARDPDDRVRVLLAGKVARLLPGLSGAEHAAAQAHIHQLLRILAEDVALNVRIALTEALGAMPHAPRDIVLRLANDPHSAVSDPVLRLSPLLTDADLMELLATPPHGGAARAVAGRPGLSAAVAEGIATHADTAAVLALLSNPSASIQEATLDALAGRAGAHPEWHEPLLRRSFLPPGAMATLSRLVVGHLLEALLARPDLPQSLAAELRDRVSAALSQPGQPATPISDAELVDGIRRAAREGTLDETRLLDAAAAGDHRTTAAIVAVASGTSLAVVHRAIVLRSAKGLVSLAHRAGFTMRAATVLQQFLGRLSPQETLSPGESASYPLTQTEMDWQIELLHEPGR